MKRDLLLPKPKFKLRTRYQRMNAAVQVATLVRDKLATKDAALFVRMQAIIILLSAPIGMVRAIEPDLEQMGVKQMGVKQP